MAKVLYFTNNDMLASDVHLHPLDLPTSKYPSTLLIVYSVADAKH